MAVAAAVHHRGYLTSKFRSSSPPSPPKIAAEIRGNTPPPPPISISINPAHVNLRHLRELYAICNHSCHRFPTVDAAGRVDPVDPAKLRTAVSHSSIVVSAFTKPEFVTTQSSTPANFIGIGGDWISNVAAPVTPENGRLIGFGRAVSDMGFTASIHDVMVHPALQGRGIGQMIVQRITRMLTNRDIYDIAALCNDDERLFFRACGFGYDVLGSTTMTYTRSASKNELIVSAGRRLLLIPPARGLTK
ncbi:hypothetical protein ABFS83_06G056100 [Erythranthe nasuta]